MMFGRIRSVLDEIASGQPEKAIQAGEKRNDELARMSWVCIEAMSSLFRSMHLYFYTLNTAFDRYSV
jgi:hypothetical protein